MVLIYLTGMTEIKQISHTVSLEQLPTVVSLRGAGVLAVI